VVVLGGGTGTRELEPLRAHANAQGPDAILLTGGSAFGLAAAEGAVAWLRQRGIGRPTPMGVVPLVPAAVIYDLHAGGEPPGPEAGRLACERARGGVPERGALGAGAGAAVGKALGRDLATRAGVGYAAARTGDGFVVAALGVANSVGDVLDEGGGQLGGPHDERGRLLATDDLLARMRVAEGWPLRAGEIAARGGSAHPRPGGGSAHAGAGVQLRAGESTTLVCVCTDAPLDKRECAIAARMAAAGIARAVAPVFTPLDGDLLFFVASGEAPKPIAPQAVGVEPTAREQPSASGAERALLLTAIGAVAATVTAEAIRDAVRSAARPSEGRG
jgi:L-aminopeptidase/D-esterase-like protein